MESDDRAEAAARHRMTWDADTVVDEDGNVSEAASGPTIEQTVRWDRQRAALAGLAARVTDPAVLEAIAELARDLPHVDADAAWARLARRLTPAQRAEVGRVVGDLTTGKERARGLD